MVGVVVAAVVCQNGFGVCERCGKAVELGRRWVAYRVAVGEDADEEIKYRVCN